MGTENTSFLSRVLARVWAFASVLSAKVEDMGDTRCEHTLPSVGVVPVSLGSRDRSNAHIGQLHQ